MKGSLSSPSLASSVRFFDGEKEPQLQHLSVKSIPRSMCREDSVASFANTFDDSQLFESLVANCNGQAFTAEDFEQQIKATGLSLSDPRLAATMTRLKTHAERYAEIDNTQFQRIVRPSAILIERAFSRQLVVKDWPAFASRIKNIQTETIPFDGGALAGYIPELAEADPATFGVAFCSVDGQQLAEGVTDVVFTAQSSSKPLTYLMAMEELGEDEVHRFIGREPSGLSFNKMVLNQSNVPHNPLINAGAIMCASLVKHGGEMSARFNHIFATWKKLTANHPSLGFSNTTFLSELDTANRNFCLAYMMQEKGAFVHGNDKSKPHRKWESHHLKQTLELYFQCCSIELDCEAAAIVAATLANGGINPLTEDRVFESASVKHALTLMLSCGMYDYSGEWAYTIGLPAKSGVSGILLVVIPNVGGFAVHSPSLDKNGNSWRGIEFCKRLVRDFPCFVNQSALADDPSNPFLDPNKKNAYDDEIVTLCFMAAAGDMVGIRSMVASGIDLSQSDYDGRTALHLASSEGHIDVVEFICNKGAELSPVDRMGGTPLSDARRGGHLDIVEYLESMGAQEAEVEGRDSIATAEETEDAGNASNDSNDSARPKANGLKIFVSEVEPETPDPQSEDLEAEGPQCVY